ncbi:E3 ubiquitin/ISG15 ligase TRIM25-like [Gastrophryne carolinensis]
MATADVKIELLHCSICENIYTDPVTLPCGDVFCWECIDSVLDVQEAHGVYCCPKCLVGFVERPELVRNTILCNTVESANPAPENRIFCTYCLDGSPLPADKYCLMCEASLCDKHLRVHSKSPEHVLTDPTASMQNKRCSIHKELLKYFCIQDAACICVSCFLAGNHRGHKVEILEEASRKKKEQLRNTLKEMTAEKKKNEEEIQILQMREALIKSAGLEERLATVVGDLKRQLMDLEQKVLCDISRQKEQISNSIDQLEKKKDDLSRKMRHVENLCNATDPAILLKPPEMDNPCDNAIGDNTDSERCETNPGDLTVSVTLQTLANIITEVNRGNNAQGSAEMLLDVNSANNCLLISDDRKTATFTKNKQDRPRTRERFLNFPIVLSSVSFSSGNHSWDIECSSGAWWEIGMCYPSTPRKGKKSSLGCSDKSWCLLRDNNSKYYVKHNCKEILLPPNVTCNRVRVSLDYEAGELSFYELGDDIKHLHTITAKFTEPLHAALCLDFEESWLKILDYRGGMAI